MNIEAKDELRRRAAIHAALSDPARLAIADALTLGDASPSELSARLHMPSNLMAHHVKVLEDAGLVFRTRSEADRRRTYLHLMPGAFDSLVPGGVRMAPRVLFVCTHNSARSVLAAALWHRVSRIPSQSAGTHPAERVNPGAVPAAARHKLPLRQRRPRHLDEVHTRGDFIVTVCDSAHEELSLDPDLHWSIPDPSRTGSDAAFEAAFEDLSRRVHDLAPRLSTP